MTDAEVWKERREQLLRYRAMDRESTDPLAAGLLHDVLGGNGGEWHLRVVDDSAPSTTATASALSATATACA